jgi:hypothetical protein
MGFGTKNRQKQTADICKQYLREKYRDRLELVEEFIVEIEGAAKNADDDPCAPAELTCKFKESELSTI